MTEPPSTPHGSGPDWGEMSGKIKAAQGADRLILIAGVLFFVDSFLPWYGFSCGGLRVAGLPCSIKGWSSGGLAVLAILFAILALALAAIRVLGAKMDLPVKDGLLYLIFGGGAFVFSLLRYVTETRLTKFGLYIAIVLGAALAFGGWQKYKSAPAA